MLGRPKRLGLTASLASVLALIACGLPIGDPKPPPVALRSDRGLITAIVQTCDGEIETVKITEISADSGIPRESPIYVASVREGGSSVRLAHEMAGASGDYDAKSRLLVEVVTKRSQAVGEWLGTTVDVVPADRGEALVDGRPMSIRAFSEGCQGG